MYASLCNCMYVSISVICTQAHTHSGSNARGLPAPELSLAGSPCPSWPIMGEPGNEAGAPAPVLPPGAFLYVKSARGELHLHHPAMRIPNGKITTTLAGFLLRALAGQPQIHGMDHVAFEIIRHLSRQVYDLRAPLGLVPPCRLRAGCREGERPRSFLRWWNWGGYEKGKL